MGRTFNDFINEPYKSIVADTIRESVAHAVFSTRVSVFAIKKVVFNNPATIVLWADGTKTVVKCSDKEIAYDAEKGLALCFMKKALGNKGNFNNVIHKWVKEEEDYGTEDTDEYCEDGEAF